MTNVDWIAEQLPLVEAAAIQPEAEWRSLLADLEGEAPSPEARESLRAMARSIRAMHQPGVLSSLRMPLDDRSARLLDRARDKALASLEERMSRTLRSAISPVAVPADAPASPLAVEAVVRSSESDGFGAGVAEPADQLSALVARELSKASQPPAWLWTRVREDIHHSRRDILSFRRSRRFVRWASAAAILVVSAVLWPLFASDDLRGGGGSRGFDIQIIPVHHPIDAASSPLAILRSARDGR